VIEGNAETTGAQDRERKSEPRAVRAIARYLIVVFIGAALLAPPIYQAAHVIARHNSHFRDAAMQPFYRYVGRCLLLVALVGLPGFFKALGVSSVSALGLRFGRRHWAEAMQGFAWGFAALAIAAALTLAFGARIFAMDHTRAEWLNQLRGAAITALIVAAIEEILFRGALFGTLRRERNFWAAALISSSIYAILHFFEKPPEPDIIQWNSGFIVLAEMFRGFAEWRMLIPGFLNLVLVGLMLALAFERTGSLLFSMGLHAGFVFWVKSFGFLTKDVNGASTWIWGTNKLVDGWMSGLLLLAIFLALYHILPERHVAENGSSQ
jgi:membrane protease YdiL (CAAX protease family)